MAGAESAMLFCPTAKKLKPQAMRPPLSSFRRDRTDSSPHRVLFPLNWAMEIVQLPDRGGSQGTWNRERKLFERQVGAFRNGRERRWRSFAAAGSTETLRKEKEKNKTALSFAFPLFSLSLSLLVLALLSPVEEN